MRARSLKDVEKVWTSVDGLKKASDRIVGLGPFGIGLDGLLTWIPGLGDLYTVGAGGFLLLAGIRAHASPMTMIGMTAALALDTSTGVVPILGNVVDFFFPGHLVAAKMLQAEIERTHWVDESLAQARASGTLNQHLAEMKARKKKRVVFLGSGQAGTAAAELPI